MRTKTGVNWLRAYDLPFCGCQGVRGERTTRLVLFRMEVAMMSSTCFSLTIGPQIDPTITLASLAHHGSVKSDPGESLESKCTRRPLRKS